MLLIEFVQNNPVLLLGTFLVLFAVSLGFYNNPLLAEIAIAGAPRSLFRVLRWPSAVLLRAHRHKRHLFLTLNFVFICLFCLVTFLYLRQTQSLAWAGALFLPLALLCMHALYYLLWICTYLVHAAVDVGNKKFNLMFSLTTIELLLIYLALPAAGRISQKLTPSNEAAQLAAPMVQRLRSIMTCRPILWAALTITARTAI